MMAGLTIQLTDGAEKCLYQQIYEHIRDEIRKGKLLAGEKLPSTRSLAEYLQVARSTVDFAYSQLVAEGYVEARPCRGYFVNQAEGLFQLLPDDLMESLAAPEGETEKSSEKLSVPETGAGMGKILYDFSPHAISLKNFPYSTWKKITKNILVDANSEMFALGDAQGDGQLRETIGRYLHASRG